MRSFIADLHVHSVLSPCGDLLMTPQNIINRSLELGLDMIAITDHNSAENIGVALELAKDTPLTIIPGMEVETVEEIHLICLFDTLDQVLLWQEKVYNSLPDFKNNEEIFGPQLLTDQSDEYMDRVDKLLLTATSLSINDVIKEVRSIGGIAIPSHVDKPNYSIISNLGFIPPDLDAAIFEISSKAKISKVIDKFNTIDNYSFISNSDAHYLQDIKRSMKLYMKAPKVKEVELALKGVNGRNAEIM
ncbi:histidinol phosphatase [Orenia metallireducens]|uniref:Histidinol phosphatase n=2 Tax=Orenia metallireducens TaxID=1413210 RepID=A0A1C0A6P5_9FIRM|nr:histidinol phosphatase [Orenia metallireducens]